MKQASPGNKPLLNHSLKTLNKVEEIGLPVSRTTKSGARVCYECPRIHRWAEIMEPWPSLPWEKLECQFKFMFQLPLN